MIFRRIIGAVVVLITAITIGVTVAAPPAQAADVILNHCPDNYGTQYLPASRNIGSSEVWKPDGFRSCSWYGRWVIRVNCGGNWNGVRPIIAIIRNGNTENDRTQHWITCNGAYHWFWDAEYPPGLQGQWYHLHIYVNYALQTDPRFDWMIIRVGQ